MTSDTTVLVPFYKSMLKPPTEKFSKWEPEASKISLTAVDNLRVAKYVVKHFALLAILHFRAKEFFLIPG